MDVGKVDLGLDAFIADPVSEATLGAQARAGTGGRARQRHGGEVDGTVEFLDDGRGRRGGPLDGAGCWLAGDRWRTADETHVRDGRSGERREAEIRVQRVDQELSFAADSARNLTVCAEVIAIREVVVEFVRVDEFGVAGIRPDGGGQPAEE